MRSLIFTLIVFFYQVAPIRAQWVTIPDTNFVTFLQQHYPSCMNGNQMDTTCTQIVGETYLVVYGEGITDLTGIEYFSNIQLLNCGGNYLQSLPLLPNSLKTLDCHNN